MGRRAFYIRYCIFNDKCPDPNPYHERPAIQPLYSRKRRHSHKSTRYTQIAVHITLGISKPIYSGNTAFAATAWAVEAFFIRKQHELVYIQGSTGDAYAKPAKHSVSVRAEC
jgi:hypothetical protein